MGNIYGISQQTPNLVNIILGGDVSCPAATNTAIGATNFTPADPGDYAAWAVGLLAILLGATPPTALTVGISHAGSTPDGTPVSIATALLVANATLMIPLGLVSNYVAIVQNQASQNPAVIVNPTGQTVTVKATGTGFVIGQIRGVNA